MIVCRIFFCFFIPLLTAPIVKNSRILAGIYFVLLKKGPRSNFSIPNLDLGEKIAEVLIR